MQPNKLKTRNIVVGPKKRPIGEMHSNRDTPNTLEQKRVKYIYASTIKREKWAWTATGRAWNWWSGVIERKKPRGTLYQVLILGRWLKDMQTSRNGRNGARLWLLMLWRYQRLKKRQPPTYGYLTNAL